MTAAADCPSARIREKLRRLSNGEDGELRLILLIYLRPAQPVYTRNPQKKRTKSTRTNIAPGPTNR